MKILLEVAAVALFSALLAVILVEWAAGCGETYVDAQGETHQHDCVILPNRS
jgi:hypothetical protein